MMKRFTTILAGPLLAALGIQAQAHTVWLEPVAGKTGEFHVLFNGHNGKIESANPQKLKSADAFDAKGRKLAVSRLVAAGSLDLKIAGQPAFVAVHLDNGIHSRRSEGPSVEAPMNEVPGAVRATRALKYHKTIVSWQASVTRPIGQAFEVVPLDASAPRAGKPFRVKVLIDGKPVAGVKLGAGEEGGESAPVTGADGVAEFTPVAGFNKMWAGRREAIGGNPAYTELSYEYLLGFTAL
jgi:nickel transport protein